MVLRPCAELNGGKIRLRRFCDETVVLTRDLFRAGVDNSRKRQEHNSFDLHSD
jgi:hypothetical protein